MKRQRVSAWDVIVDPVSPEEEQELMEPVEKLTIHIPAFSPSASGEQFADIDVPKLVAQARRHKKPRQDHFLEQVKESVNATRFMIGRLPFTRMVKEISMSYSGCDSDGEPLLKWDLEALNTLHENAELYLTELFSDATNCTLHAKRKTLYREDIQLVRKLRGPNRLF